jgi:hypothetical protein
LDHLVLARRRHQHPGRGDARLPGGHRHCDHRPDRRAVDGVVEVELCRLAAELERHALHRRRGLGEDPASDRGRSGERHHVDRRVGGEQLGAVGALLHDHAEHPGRDAGRLGGRAERE